MMKTRMVVLSIAVPLCWSLSFPTRAIDDTPTAYHVPLKSMNEAEFEKYRRQLNLTVKGISSTTPKQDTATGNQAPIASGEIRTDRIETKRTDGGYGKGYGARGGLGNNGALRGSSMSGGGGRNR